MGKWLVDTIQCSGYRLDAIKHINHDFIKQFAVEMQKKRGEDFYIFGEFWNPDLADCRDFLDTVDYKIDLFDVSLHYKLQAASQGGRAFDLRTILDDTLVQSHPLHAVTFVDNHDSQPQESLESWVQDGFKPSAYALILLRKDGYPVVFYGDYYGIGGEHPIPGKRRCSIRSCTPAGPKHTGSRSITLTTRTPSAGCARGLRTWTAPDAQSSSRTEMRARSECMSVSTAPARYG